MEPVVNVLLDSFPGLSLPPTLCLPLPASTSLADLFSSIRHVLPKSFPTETRLILTSTSNVPVYDTPSVTLGDLTWPSTSCQPGASGSLLPLRLSAPLVGGKGGFGSQLRAAGGRMSARKKRQNAEAANGSARNLDGRRMRTITEAKNLATYLATKPEMDKKEKEERRKRWEQVIDLAEQREADMRAGKGPDGRRKGLSDQWVDEKEEVGENVRNAVKQAMSAIESEGKDKGKSSSRQEDESSGSGGSAGASEEDSEEDDVMELDDSEMARLREEAERGDADAIWVLKERLKIPSHLLPEARTQPTRRFAGFDDDDDYDDDESDEDQDDSKSKGKQMAIPV
ncbi:hypothetical protein B0A52_07618 [Exophiala mesophila]|uniref:Uncharacterized protein n=1 Tax=Exophiala mesophila TaxID=212818 RepID=A0A438MYB5_EXOME|nr:hypothetical protein B0A52_07618 [Exophiala mesophila]